MQTPWGSWTTLHIGYRYAVKILYVKPGKRLSLQSHEHRDEHWHIVNGEATCTAGDHTWTLRPGDSLDVPARIQHRIGNDTTELVTVVEVQTGSGAADEDDIVRYEDDFGRS